MFIKKDADKTYTKILFLNLLTFFNHAVVSWLILALPKIQGLIGAGAAEQHIPGIIILGVLMSVKPIVEGLVAFIYSLKSSFSLKKSLLLCLFGGLSAAMCFVMAIQSGCWLLIPLAQAFLGLSCSAIFFVQVGIAEWTSASRRTSFFNVMEWSVGIGMSLGPILGAWCVHLAHQPSYARPFFAVIAITCVLAIFLSRLRLAPIEAQSVTQSSSRRSFFYYMSAWVAFMFAWQGYFHWFPTLMYTHFNFSHHQLGTFSSFLGVIYLVCQFGLVSWFTQYNIHRYVVVISLPVMGGCFLVMGITHSLIIMCIVSLIYMIAISFFLPFWKAHTNLLGLRSHHRLFSTMTIATSLCAMASTLLGGVFASFSLPLSFLLFGLFMCLAMVLFLSGERSRRLES